MFWEENNHPGYDSAQASLDRLLPITDSLYSVLLSPLFPDKLPSLIHIVPDGPLATLPFESFRTPRGVFLLYEADVIYHSTAGTIARSGPINKTGILSAWAPMIYDSLIPPQEYAEIRGGLTSSGFMSGEIFGRFSPLSSSSQEVDSVSRVWLGKSECFKRERANEIRLKWMFSHDEQARPSVVFFSTHGFFVGDTMMNPMVASGIALYGANKGIQWGEDGILTAMEILSLNLKGVELVYFSACEVGLGISGSGEGIFGLRRSLSMAGASNQVITLWPVHPNIAMNHSVLFFSKLMNGLSPHVAISQAKRELLSGLEKGMVVETKEGKRTIKMPPHPMFWAGWVMGR